MQIRNLKKNAAKHQDFAKAVEVTKSSQVWVLQTVNFLRRLLVKVSEWFLEKQNCARQRIHKPPTVRYPKNTFRKVPI